MVRIFLGILVIGILVTQYQLWAGRSSWFRLRELEQSLAEQRAANERLRASNEELAAELYSLVNQRDAIEERARRELTMVRPKEVLFRFETPQEENLPRTTDEMPDYAAPDIKPGAEPTFDAKNADLYRAPKNLRAPKVKDRRE